ncbi:uncharacterized protein LOC119630235 [Bombyx mori]|uniref:Uncharacterized protein n=1 Tax=Bombyx mori TaxID=7091 RepID=A0A8R2R298_BOMMO|nr:uncharacterized protein LOC119630235 [Bombyx mori]
MKSVRRVSSLPNSCSCSSCLYRTESERPSLSRIVSHGSKIDKLYYGKYIPLRERKLLEKLVRTRAVYDNIRDQLISSSSTSGREVIKSKQVKGKHKIINNENEADISEVIGLVDNGVILTPETSECCSCCSCSTAIKISNETVRPMLHKHVPNQEKRSMTSKSSVISRQRANDEMKNEYNVRFKTKQIKSDPCTCTYKIGKIIKRHSRAVLRKLGGERAQPLIETHRGAFEEHHHKRRVGAILRKSYQHHKNRTEEGPRKSIKNNQDSQTKFKDNLNFESKRSEEKIKRYFHKVHPKIETLRQKHVRTPITNENIEGQDNIKGKVFKIKKDSVTQFREKLRKKHDLRDWECADTCFEQKCKPEQCYKELLKKISQTTTIITKEKGNRVHENRTKHKKTNLSKLETNKAIQMDVDKHSKIQVKKGENKTKDNFTKVTNNTLKQSPKNKQKQHKSKQVLTIRTNVNMTEKKSSIRDFPPPFPIIDKATSKQLFKNKEHGNTINKETLLPNTRKKEISKSHITAITKSPQKRHKQNQSKKIHLAKSKQSGHLLKRCFCTLKLKKKSIINRSKSDFNTSKPNSTQSYEIRQKTSSQHPNKLLTKCDRQICKIGECDPNECKKQIRIRVSKHQGLSKADLKNEDAASNMNISFPRFHIKNLRTPDNENETRHVLNSQDQIPQRQVVRISSTFSFDIEFSKLNVSEPQFQRKIEEYKKQRIEQKKKSVKENKGTDKRRINTQNKNSQISNSSSKSTKTSLKYGIRRCFCTLKINNNRVIQDKSKNTSKATLTSGKLEAQPNLKSVSTNVKIKVASNKKSKKILLPYECDPGVCVPGKCDPYKCLQIIKLRETKTLKRHSVKSNTENKNTRSSVTITPKYIVPLKTKKVQSAFFSNKRVYKNDSVKRSVSVPKQVKEFSNNPTRQAVRIGSSFSFDIQFSKEKQDSDIKPYAIRDKSISQKQHTMIVVPMPLKNSRTQVELKSNNKSTMKEIPKKTISLGPTLRKCFCTLKFHKSPQIKHQSQTVEKTKSGHDFSKSSTIRNQEIKYKVEQNECEPYTCVPTECDPYKCLENIKKRNYKRNFKDNSIVVKPNLKSVHSLTKNHIAKNKNISISASKKPKKETNQISDRIKKDALLDSSVSQEVNDIRRSQVKIGSNFNFGIEFYKDKSIKSFDRTLNGKARGISKATTQSVVKNIKNEGVQITKKSKSKNFGVSSVMKRCFCTLALQKQKRPNTKPIHKPNKPLTTYTVNRLAVESVNYSKTFFSCNDTSMKNNDSTEQKTEGIRILKLTSTCNINDCFTLPTLTLPKNDTFKHRPYVNQSFYSMNVSISTINSVEKHFKSIPQNAVDPYSYANDDCHFLLSDEKVQSRKSRMSRINTFSVTSTNNLNKLIKIDSGITNEHLKYSKLNKTNKEMCWKTQKDLIQIGTDFNFDVVCTKDNLKDKQTTSVFNQKYSNHFYTISTHYPAVKNVKCTTRPYVRQSIFTEKNNNKYSVEISKCKSTPNYLDRVNSEKSSSFFKRCFDVLKSLTAKTSFSRADKVTQNVSQIPQLTSTKLSGTTRLQSLECEQEKYASNICDCGAFKPTPLPHTKLHTVRITKRSCVDLEKTKMLTSKIQKFEIPSSASYSSINVDLCKKNKEARTDGYSITRIYSPTYQRYCTNSKSNVKYHENDKSDNEEPIKTNTRTSGVGLWTQKCLCTLALYKQSFYRNRKHNARQSSQFSNSSASANSAFEGKRTKGRKLDPFECEPYVCIPGQCDPYECDKRIRRRFRRDSGVGTNAIRETSQSTRTPKPKIPKSIKIQSLPKSTKLKRLGETSKSRTTVSTKHTNESRKAVRIGSKFSFDIEFYKNKKYDESFKFTKLPKDFHRKVANKERASVTTRASDKKNQDFRHTRHADTQNEPEQVKSTMTTSAPFLKRCFCTMKLHTNTTSSFDATTQDALPESPSYTMMAEKGTKTKKFKQPPIYNLEPYECEPGVCIPGQCDPYECDKRIRLRRKMQSVSSNTQRDTRSSASVQYNPHKHKARRSQFHSKYPKRHKQSYVNQLVKSVSEKIPHRQAVRIGSNFSFNIEFYKDVPSEQGYRRDDIKTKDRTQSEAKVKKSPAGVQGISFRHRQSQISGPKIKSRDSGANPILKRCFCTLKLHKAGKQKVEQTILKPKSQTTFRSSFTETKKAKICPENCLYNAGTATTGKNIYKLEPYECEPYVCTPGYCDPYECDLRIRRRQMKTMCTETDCPRLKEIGSLATKSYTSKSMKTLNVKQKNAQLSALRDKPRKYRTSKVIEDNNNMNKQSVRIGSTFSFNIEFFKEGDALSSTPIDNDYKDKADLNVNRRNRTRNKSISSDTRKLKSQFSEKRCPLRCQKTQAETVQKESRGSGISPLLKRCFCTLALHKKNAEIVQTDQPQIDETPKKIIQAMASKSTLTKNKYLSYDLKSYECEPGTCEPGLCNPYECEKRIKARNAKYNEIGTDTDPHHYFSASSMTKDNTTSRKCKNIQCKGKERSYATASPQIKRTTLKDNEHVNVDTNIKNRQVVKIGSSFNFDVEFFKDKPSPETRSRPSTQDRIIEKNYRSDKCNTKCQGIKNVNTQPNKMLTTGESQVDYVKTENKGSYVENVLKRCFCTMALHKNDMPNVGTNQKNNMFSGKQYQVYYQLKTPKIKGAQKLDVSSKDCPCSKQQPLISKYSSVATNTSKKYFKNKLKEQKQLETKVKSELSDQKSNNMETILPYKPRKFNKKTSKTFVIDEKSENTSPKNMEHILPDNKISTRLTKTKIKVTKLDIKPDLKSKSTAGRVKKIATSLFDSKLFNGKIELGGIPKMTLKTDVTNHVDGEPVLSILKSSKSEGGREKKNKAELKSSHGLKIKRSAKNKLGKGHLDKICTQEGLEFKSGDGKPVQISRAVLKLYRHDSTLQSRKDFLDVEDQKENKLNKNTQANKKNKMVKFSIDPATNKKSKKKRHSAVKSFVKKVKSETSKCDDSCYPGASENGATISGNKLYSKNKKEKKSHKLRKFKLSKEMQEDGINDVNPGNKTGDENDMKPGEKSQRIKKKGINICDCSQFRDDMICTCFSSNCECAKAIKIAKKKEKEMKIRRKKLQKKIKRQSRELQEKEKALKKKRQDLDNRRKKYKREDEARQKRRRKSEKYLDKRIRKLKDTSDILLAADSLLDIAKLGFSVAQDVGRSTCRAITDPCYTYDSVKSTLKHPTRIWPIIKNAILNSGAVATLKRVFRRFQAMETVKSTRDKLNDYEITSYIMGMAESDPRKRLKRKTKKRVQPRRDKDFQCNLYMNSLRKKPYLSVYYTCPWFYPHFMTMLNAIRQITDLLLFLLAAFVWSPCILCTELCRAMLCCFVCTG